MKKCSKCKIKKDESEFHKSNRDGLVSVCKQCRKIKDHERYLKNKDKILNKNNSWRQKNKEYTLEQHRKYNKKNREEINRKIREKYANDPIGREKRLKFGKVWRENNEERKKIMDKNWKLANPDKVQAKRENRRAREKGAIGSYTSEEWIAKKSEFNNTCPCCGKSEPEIKLTIDHAQSLVKGGSNYIDNIQPLCEKCNKSKGSKCIKYYPFLKEKEPST